MSTVLFLSEIWFIACVFFFFNTTRCIQYRFVFSFLFFFDKHRCEYTHFSTRQKNTQLIYGCSWYCDAFLLKEDISRENDLLNPIWNLIKMQQKTKVLTLKWKRIESHVKCVCASEERTESICELQTASFKINIPFCFVSFRLHHTFAAFNFEFFATFFDLPFQFIVIVCK